MRKVTVMHLKYMSASPFWRGQRPRPPPAWVADEILRGSQATLISGRMPIAHCAGADGGVVDPRRIQKSTAKTQTSTGIPASSSWTCIPAFHRENSRRLTGRLSG